MELDCCNGDVIFDTGNQSSNFPLFCTKSFVGIIIVGLTTISSSQVWRLTWAGSRDGQNDPNQQITI